MNLDILNKEQKEAVLKNKGINYKDCLSNRRMWNKSI